VLEKINEPNDIHKIPERGLVVLANEIRRYIIETVSSTGGHLASNLGSVELTVALHSICSFPEDKLIWDVGHQSYTHKILTGRKELMKTLRQEGGISGFSRIEESDCDSFNSGHSSTSVSAGLGYVRARELSGKDYKVISVIGDGALTGGMAYEALNNAADIKKNFVIVLNDNKMSISRNIGGMANYLSEVRTSARYNSFKSGVTAMLEKVPLVGEHIIQSIRTTKSGIKQLFIPGMLFENMGITYLGPIDGHNISLMIKTFKDALRVEGPVIVHVLTEKGRGYMPARKDPEKFHGISAFDIKTGKPLKEKKKTYSDVFSDTICELAEKNEKIVAVTAAMKEGTGLEKFGERFPNRLFDVGIAEEHAVTFAAGMALGGYIPVAAIYSSFLQRAFDQIMMDICTQKQHVILAVDRAGFVGEDGMTHQGCFDLSYLTMMPNMTVMAPKDGVELKEMLKFAADLHGPVAVRYPRGEAFESLTQQSSPIEYGKGEIIKRGEKAALLAIGASVKEAIEAARILSERKIEITVVNMRFAKPLDEELICELAKDHDLFVTMEENIKPGGFGEKVLDAVNRYRLRKPVYIASAGEDFVYQGTVAQQRKRTGTDGASVAEKITELILDGDSMPS
jgi:1-deoxy-D-xylulose-5-phosphate synthase